ncbi:hypothetical protein TSTA_083590 [Talaromyces stipitatus ATCC 10500]|uniref:Tc1-like transposase DDE domain-containing protein n=1 Tax=Talaromyces stipitatus (strain ATCC 10500 / CBS 375.48 / QM 6759 / NRRL 1006) TaxID=441959 RepID=B8LZ83_TALSN|nr:uncharacterized protein TSTA_083590 [Talaromyces stipitatus ATCC 10500]EED21127.1 hypothetical protein TSTA_083590 [Talaromyces stipitatus ATCC 10500]
MYSKAGVKLVYLPPYSPDLNPIEELSAELKTFIRRHWQSGALKRRVQGSKVQKDIFGMQEEQEFDASKRLISGPGNKSVLYLLSLRVRACFCVRLVTHKTVIL